MNSPLKIAIFSDSYLPIANGVSVSIDSYVGELRRRGHSVFVYTSRFPGYKDADPNVRRFFAFETPWSKGYPLAVPPFFPLLREFRARNFDIVHTHTPFTIGMVGLRWAESSDVPIVSTYHTLYDRYAHYVPYVPRRYTRFKIAKHTNFYYDRVSHVITPSEASYRWLKRHGVSTPISVVPTGVTGRRILDRTEMRQAIGIRPDERALLYVGRIAREKNLQTLFEAVAMVFKREPQATLWLVGDGPDRERCIAIVRNMNIGDRVRFVGMMPRAEVDRFYAACDLFVFPSYTETQGLVIQEAMTYGLPAVVVQGGGATAAITDGYNAIAVRNEPEALSASIIELLRDDDLYCRLSDGALKSVREIGIGRMCDDILDIYGSVIEVGVDRETSLRV